MKKKRRIIFIILIVLLILAPKSRIEMLYNARREFRNVFLRIKEGITPNDFQGPVIQKSDRYKNELVFKWYKELPFKDTAWVNVYIPRIRFRGVDITMNEGINYLTRKRHNLYEFFPSCKDSSLRINEEALNQLFKTQTSYETINKGKLVTILQEGFYDVVKVNEELTFLVFWESFLIDVAKKDKIETKYSIVDLDDECQVTLKPFLLPDSIKSFLVLKEDGYHYVPELKY